MNVNLVIETLEMQIHSLSVRCNRMAAIRHPSDHELNRTEGKIEGLRLALSYIKDGV